jgi:hypothetical protein
VDALPVNQPQQKNPAGVVLVLPSSLWGDGANAGSRTRINGFGGHYTIHCATLATNAAKIHVGAFAVESKHGAVDAAYFGSAREYRCTNK